MRVLFFAMALFVGAVLAWVISGPHKTVIHDRPRPGSTVVQVIQSPAGGPTPRDSGPKNNTPARSQLQARKVVAGRGQANSGARKLDQPQNRRVPVKTRRTPRPKAKRPAAPQRPAQPSQPPPSPQQPQPDPGPALTVPLPSFCSKPISIGTCP